jgi:hypothetical protein
MAADTRDKRFSLLLRGLGWGRVLPSADGSFNADDRRHLLPLYRGPLAAAPVAVVGFMPDAAFVEVATPSRATITEVTLPNRGTILDE